MPQNRRARRAAKAKAAPAFDEGAETAEFNRRPAAEQHQIRQAVHALATMVGATPESCFGAGNRMFRERSVLRT